MADRFSPAVRSRIMSRIRSRNTGLEVLVFRALRREGLRFQKHYRLVPGTPDAAWPMRRVLLFIDGDFWHGWRYPTWRHKLKDEFWRSKIERNRARDRRNFAKLRRQGWQVIRLWEHEVKRDLTAATRRVVMAVEAATPATHRSGGQKTRLVL